MSSKKNSFSKVLEIKSRMLADKIKGKKIIILDIEETTFIPYIFPIYNALNQKTNKISYYIASHYTGNEQLNVFGIPFKKQFGVNLSREFSSADIFLSPHIYGVGNIKSKKIHINHNQPVKYESYQKNDFINFDIHFLTSPLHREQTENTIKKYKLEDRNIKLYDIGYSKSDQLLKGKYHREDVLNQLKLDPAHKTVLYSPSWDEGLSLRTFGDKVIENILKVKNINLIVKLHPISYCPKNGPNYIFYTGGTDWIKKFSKFDSYPDFRHVPSNNIDPLLSAADVMVTDLSSVALEFIVLDKPVIYIDCPEFFEKTLKNIYSNFGDTTAEFVKNDPKANAGRHVGKIVSRPEELPEAILNSLANPGELSDKRKELARKLSYNPGNASNTAADKIMNILGL
ncbi:MAG TPA: CDP-glycerol glycerophosphotransferase family protein [Ignavibacteria bacterium]|nr:CDP-glycerol glycerophosphotransferase family protein [Ignavibacteria bacterium]